MVQTSKNRLSLLALVALALAVFLGGVALFESGWRLGRAGLVRIAQGRVCVEAPLAPSVLYIDTREVGTSRANGKELCGKITRGEHALLLAAPGAWPWSKKITSDTAEHSYRAFTLPQEIERIPLEPGTREYIVAQNMLVTSLVPDASSPLRSQSGALALWYEEDARELRAEWRGEETELPEAFCESGTCARTITILENVAEPPRALALASERDDIVFLAIGTGVYILEITTASNPNFQPIYRGTNPTFVFRDARSIYVGDGSPIFKIPLDKGL